MTRMFRTVTKSWSVFSGCQFDCQYCWARSLIEGRLQHHTKYRNRFEPTFHPAELKKTFKPGEFVFVAAMGDIRFADSEARHLIQERISDFPRTNFLIQTKDPNAFSMWPNWDNLYFGTTIESNREYGLSQAPPVAGRYMSLFLLKRPHKFVSIEPILDFDMDILLRWLQDIRPEIVEVGADNYKHSLQEPSWGKVETLLEALRAFVPRVVEKEGLERLRGER